MIGKSALWIASWPELRAVDDADYKEAMHRSVMMNPLREPRLVVRSVAGLTQQMTTWFYVGVGLACTNASPPEVKLSVGGGAVYDIEGEKQTAFYIRTNADTPRFCVVTDKHAAAYEIVDDNPPMPKIGDVEGLKQAMKDGRLAQYKGLTAGRKLSQIEPKTIAGFIELAKEYNAPAALDLLLRKAGIDPKDAAVSPAAIMPASGGPAVNSLVVAGGQALIAQSSPAGSVLLRTGDHTHLAKAPKSDIADHAARVEASTPRLA